MIEKIGGRKVFAALLVIAVGVGAVLLKGDVPANLLQLLQVVFGALVVGNVGEHVVGAVRARAEAGSTEPVAGAVDLSPVAESLQRIEQGTNNVAAGMSHLLSMVNKQ
jgi:hypothetical protein